MEAGEAREASGLVPSSPWSLIPQARSHCHWRAFFQGRQVSSGLLLLWPCLQISQAPKDQTVFRSQNIEPQNSHRNAKASNTQGKTQDVTSLQRNSPEGGDRPTNCNQPETPGAGARRDREHYSCTAPRAEAMTRNGGDSHV